MRRQGCRGSQGGSINQYAPSGTCSLEIEWTRQREFSKLRWSMTRRSHRTGRREQSGNSSPSGLRRIGLLVVLGTSLNWCAAQTQVATNLPPAPRRPSIILILADDLG